MTDKVEEAGLTIVELETINTPGLQTEGYKVVSGPRTTGDGYYESCIIEIEENQIRDNGVKTNVQHG